MNIVTCETDADCPDKTVTDKDGKEKTHKYSCGEITKTTGQYKTEKFKLWHSQRVMDLPE